MKELTTVSIFSGAGGLDRGFEGQGFHTVWINDFDHDACMTHRRWSQADVVCDDISKINLSAIPASDVILGGFPCQGFSLSGPRKIDDSRNTLYQHYVRLVKQNQPLVFVGENVKGLLTMGNGQIMEAIVAEFAACGYDLFYQLINARNYGVPQDRERVIIVGFRKDLGIRSFSLQDYKGKQTTLYDAIGKMPSASKDEVCWAPYSSRYMSRNRKRDWNHVSYTIPAMAKQVALHPASPDMVRIGKDAWEFGTNGETRRLSWREAAAIQTFPEDMEFFGSLESVYKQIGNAVPMKLAGHIAKSVRAILEACV